MPKVKILANQKVYYEKIVELDDRDLERLRKRLDSQMDLEPDDLYLNTIRDVYDADEIDIFDVEVSVQNQDGEWIVHQIY